MNSSIERPQAKVTEAITADLIGSKKLIDHLWMNTNRAAQR
jgi:hypothetical protein